MKKLLPLLTLGSAVAVFLAGTSPAMADETADAANAPAHPAAPSAGEALFASPLPAEELSGNRGGADLHVSEVRAVGTMTEVAVSDVVTGHNMITDGALAGANGFPMFIQNTGNGVLIQNAVVVNLEMN